MHTANVSHQSFFFCFFIRIWYSAFGETFPAGFPIICRLAYCSYKSAIRRGNLLCTVRHVSGLPMFVLFPPAAKDGTFALYDCTILRLAYFWEPFGLKCRVVDKKWKACSVRNVIMVCL